MKSIRDLQKERVNLSGIIPGTVEEPPKETQPAKSEPKTDESNTISGSAEQPESVESNAATGKLSDNEANDNKRERKANREEITSVPFVKRDILQTLLSKERQYNNSNKPIVIDTELKTSLEILSSVSCVPISTIANNLLYLMFNNASDFNLNFEITEYMIKRQKENINKFKTI